MGRETFKGVDRRFLVRLNSAPEDSGPSSGYQRKGTSTGFDDTIQTVDGLVGGPTTSAGTGAGGALILDLPSDFEKRKLALLKSLEKETNSIKICEQASLIKDNVKELVREAYLKSKELSRITKEEIYTVHPAIALQKPHETECEVRLGSLPNYMSIENSVRKEINTIQRRLFDLVMDELAPRWIPGAERGKRIDRRLLARVPLGERSFFKYKMETNILSVAFTLLIDESGSMGAQKSSEAARCAVMFGKILDKLGVPFEIIGYTTASITSAQQTAYTRMNPAAQRMEYNRAENLRHFMYKRFHEQYNQVKTKLTGISAYRNNYDQDSIEFAWNRLKQYTALNGIERKIMIVISDGQPNGGREGRIKLKKVINEIGCDPNAEIIGIGIFTDYVKDFYHKCIEITNVKELGLNVVNLLQSTIKKGRRKW